MQSDSPFDGLSFFFTSVFLFRIFIFIVIFIHNGGFVFILSFYTYLNLLFSLDNTMTTVVFHNPKCGTSRNTLALIRHAGIEPTVIEYLKEMPSKDSLRALIAAANLSVRDAMRAKEALFTELGLADASLSDDALLDAMIAHPVLLNRPFVQTPVGVSLCRPSELVLDLLPTTFSSAFVKEDGEAVLDEQGQRIKK